MVICINVYNKYLLIAKSEYHLSPRLGNELRTFDASDHMYEETICLTKTKREKDSQL